MLNYCNYKDVSKFLDHVKYLEQQISVTDIVMTSNKQSLFCLTMSLWNESHY